MAKGANLEYVAKLMMGLDVDGKSIKEAEKQGARLAETIGEEFEKGFKNFGNMINSALAKANIKPIPLDDILDTSNVVGTLNKLGARVQDVFEKNIGNGIKDGINTALRSSMLKNIDELNDAYGRHKNASGAKTGVNVRAGLRNTVKKAFEYEPSDKPIGIGRNLATIKGQFEKATNWEDQYAALLKYIKAYEALERTTSDLKSLDKWKMIGEYAIEDLKAARPEIEHSLQNIFNVAYGKMTTGLTSAGDIDLDVKLTPIKMIDAYDVAKGGQIEVEVVPVVKKAKENVSPNIFRGVHEPSIHEGKRISRETLGANYWADPKSEEFIARAYGDDAVDDGKTIKAHARPLNALEADAKVYDENGKPDYVLFNEIDKIKLLQHLFPGVEKFKNVADPSGGDAVQKFYNEMARQSGFDMFSLNEVDEGGGEVAFTKVPLQERILEYIGNIPEYLDIDKFTPEMERDIISRQKGSAERWYNDTISRLEGEYIVAQDAKDNDLATELSEVLNKVKSMREAAMQAFDQEIAKYGGYDEDAVKQGLPKVVDINEDGDLVGKITEDALKERLSKYADAVQKSDADINNKSLQNEVNEIQEQIIAALPKKIQENAFDVLSDFAYGDKSIDEAMEYFAPHLAYKDDILAQQQSFPENADKITEATRQAADAAERKAQAEKEAAEAQARAKADAEAQAKADAEATQKTTDLLRKMSMDTDDKTKERMSLMGADNSFNTVMGDDYAVGTDRLVSQLVGNLKENILMSLHNHPDGALMFTPSDIRSYGDLYKDQGVDMHGIISDGLIKTIDFSGVSKEIILKIAQDYSDNLKKYAEQSDGLFKYENDEIIPIGDMKEHMADPEGYEEVRKAIINMSDGALNEAFANNGFKSSLLSTFDSSQLSQLSEHLLQVQKNTQNVLTPMEKLQQLIPHLFSSKGIGNINDVSALQTKVADNENVFKFLEQEGLLTDELKEKYNAVNQEIQEKISLLQKSSAGQSENKDVGAPDISQVDNEIKALERQKEILEKMQHVYREDITDSEIQPIHPFGTFKSEEDEIRAYAKELNLAQEEAEDFYYAVKNYNLEAEKFQLSRSELKKKHRDDPDFDFDDYKDTNPEINRYSYGQLSRDDGSAFLPDFGYDVEDNLSRINARLETLYNTADEAAGSVDNLGNSLDKLGTGTGTGDASSAEVERLTAELKATEKQVRSLEDQLSFEKGRTEAEAEHARAAEASYHEEELKNKELQEELARIKADSDGKKLVDNDAPDDDSEERRLRAELEDERNAREYAETNERVASQLRYEAEQEAAEAKAEVERLRKQLADVDTTPKIDGGDVDKTNIEESQLKALKETVEAVTTAVDLKTKAFQNEGEVVGQAVGQEIDDLTRLQSQVKEVDETVLKLVGNLKNIQTAAKAEIKVKVDDTDTDNNRTKKKSPSSQNDVKSDSLPKEDLNQKDIEAYVNKYKKQRSLYDEYERRMRDLGKIKVTATDDGKALRPTDIEWKNDKEFGQYMNFMEEKEKALHRMMALQEEFLSKYGRDITTELGGDTNTSSAVEQQNKLQEELEETQVQAEKTKEKVKEATSKIEEKTYTEETPKRNKGELTQLEKQYQKLGQLYARLDDDNYPIQSALIENLEDEIKRRQEALGLTEKEIAALKEKMAIAEQAENRIIQGEKEQATKDKEVADNLKFARDVEDLGKKYERLGTLQAQADAGDLGKAEEARQLEAIIQDETKRLGLLDAQNAKILEGLQLRQQEAQASKAAVLAAKAQQKDDNADWKAQVKAARGYTGVNVANSAITAGNKTVTNVIGDASITSDIEAKARELQEAVKALSDMRDQANRAINSGADVDSDGLARQTKQVQELTEEMNELMAIHKKYADAEDIKADVDSFKNLDIDEYRKQLTAIAEASVNGKLRNVEFKNETKELIGTVKTGANTFTTYSFAIDKVDGKMKKLNQGTKKTETFFEGVGRKFKELAQYALSSISVYDVWNQIRNGIQYVREIDTAMTELRKVTDESEASYDRFLDTASQTGARIGSTISDFTQATATFAKLGYNMDEASKMAESAIVYQNVGDGIESAEAAAESIISTMKGFGLEASNTMSIVDSFNEVGNRFAIGSKGIGDALQRSASAMAMAGNSMHETIGLATAANTVVDFVPRSYSNIATSR